MSTTEVFEGDNWKWKALEDYIAYKELHEFVNNEAALNAHLGSYRLDALAPNLFNEEHTNGLLADKRSAIDQAFSHQASLTLISLCTTYEVMLRDFLVHLFIKSPLKLFDFIGTDQAKGHVSLREVVESESHDQLIERLACRGASVASKGKYGQALSRAASLAGTQVDAKQIEALNELQTTRNRVVHDRLRGSSGFDEVKWAHTTVDAAIEAVCEIGVSNEIPGLYTCVRPAKAVEIHGVAILVPK
ncbi:MAG: hypothetical protein U1D69_06870 [Polynucleobacter sp.]|uniref:hypothetical protein n=1 Tax=Limnobacter sp. TaxID=2003368 RepID=UPI002736C248|nr:hypothetical protein [Limnobacter sp.]MDP3272027.1 hypothetical protein [Limnobacter sp.]MDZ4056678.1 hypothetical protein [Polynucleobacter sp.]